MFDPIPHVRRGQMPSASEMNALIDRLNRVSTGPTMYTPPGLQPYLPPPPPPRIELYELTTAPVLDDDSREYYAMGKRVGQSWCAVDNDGHWVADGDMVAGNVLRCRREETAPEQDRLWFLAVARNGHQEPLSPPGAFASGDRVFVVWWWTWKVVLSHPPDEPQYYWRWGKLDEGIQPGAGNHATVSIWSAGASPYDTGIDIEAYAPPILSNELATGHWVRVDFSVYDGLWFITSWPEPIYTEEDVITDVQINTEYGRLEVKTRKTYLADAEDESEWTSKFTFAAQTVETGFRHYADTFQLQNRKRLIGVIPIDNESEADWTDITTQTASAITSFQVDEAGRELERKNTNVLKLGHEDTPWSVIHEGDECPPQE